MGITQWVMDCNPRVLDAQNTLLVQISDDDWRDTPFFQHLTNVVTAAAKREPRCIILDFQFTSGSKNDLLPFHDAIVEVSKSRPVILPLTLRAVKGSKDVAVEDSTLFQFEDLKPGTGGRISQHPGIRYGFINGDNSDDVRLLPLKAWRDGTNDEVPAIYLAAIRAAYEFHPSRRLRELEEWGKDSLRPVIQFIPADLMPTVGSTAFLRESDKTMARTRGSFVVIGGTYHLNNTSADEFPTPVGIMSGAAIHAQNVEALVDGHYFRQASGLWVVVPKLLAEIILISTILMTASVLMRFLMLAVVVLVMALLSFVALENFGTALDFVLPVLGVAVSFLFDLVEQFQESRRQKRENRLAGAN